MPKFLVIQTASIGDVILSTSLLEKIHAHYNDSTIDVLVKSGMESLFNEHPFIRKAYTWNKKTRKFRNLFEILNVVYHEKYDYVINIQRFALTGLFAVLSGAGQTRGFNKNPFSLFFGKRVKHTIRKEGKHEVERNHELIKDLTDNAPAPVRLYPSKTDFAKVSQYKTSGYICIAPASLWYTKQYPAEKWMEFIKLTDKKLHIYFIGSNQDKNLIDYIIEQSGHSFCLNLAGRLTFLETAALMKDARMNYVNDSAPLHLASAMNAPVTAIFCSTVPAFGFGPLSDDAVIVETEENLKCRPCGLHGFKKCPEKHFDCAFTVKTEKLLSRI